MIYQKKNLLGNTKTDYSILEINNTISFWHISHTNTPSEAEEKNLWSFMINWIHIPNDSIILNKQSKSCRHINENGKHAATVPSLLSSFSPARQRHSKEFHLPIFALGTIFLSWSKIVRPPVCELKHKPLPTTLLRISQQLRLTEVASCKAPKVW